MSKNNINRLKMLSRELQMNWAMSEAITLKLQFSYLKGQ